MDELSFSDLALSASVGGLLSSVLTTPLDVIKTRSMSSRQATVSSPAILTIVRREGISALWSGLRPALAITIPSTVIYMSAYDTLRDRIEPVVGKQTAGLLSGGCSRSLSCLATAPLEFVRTRAQAGCGPSAVGTVALARRDGIGVLWRGASASMARDVPFSCLYWCLYEAIRAHAFTEPSAPSASMASAVLAAGIAAVPTTPLDVVKTRAQVHDGGRAHQSVGIVLLELYTSGGVRALFRGVVPRVIKVAPSCAIIVGAYETAKKELARRKHGRAN